MKFVRVELVKTPVFFSYWKFRVVRENKNERRNDIYHDFVIMKKLVLFGLFKRWIVLDF